MGVHSSRARRPGHPLIRLLLAAMSAGAVMVGCGGKSQTGPAEATVAISDGGAAGEPVIANECVPYDDTCSSGKYCQYLEGRTQCVAEGGLARDETCNGARCQRGSICMFGGGSYGDVCQQPCSLDGTYECSLTRHTCFAARGDEGQQLSFGVCRYFE